MERFWIVPLMLSWFLGVPSMAAAGDYQIIVVNARLFPTKANRSCWDVCGSWDSKKLYGFSRRLVGQKGLSGWRKALAASGVSASLKGTKMPDPYVKLKFSNGQTFQSPVRSNTLTPRWGSGTRVALSGKETLEIEVWDKDLRNDDRIGHFPPKRIPARFLQRGGTWQLRFQQVYELRIMVVKVQSATRGLFAPGLYEVTIQYAQIRPTKKNGKPWDAFNGKPDVYVVLKIGKKKIATPVEKDALKPKWNFTKRLYLNGNESFHLAVWDRDIYDHDLIGTCRYATVAQVPFDAQNRLRAQCQQAKLVVIQLKKIR